MSEEILPRLQKMRAERDLFNEYQQLGRNIQKMEQTLIAFQWWNACVCLFKDWFSNLKRRFFCRKIAESREK